MSRITFILLAVVFLTIAGLVLRQQGRVDNGQSYSYVTSKIKRGKLREIVTATGTVTAVVMVNVGSQQSGLIDKLYVDFNDLIEDGAPLARLDQKVFQAKRDEAKAEVDMVKAEINIRLAAVHHAELEIRNAEAQLPVLKARLEYARARYDAADADFNRKAMLRDKGSVSVRDYDRARAERLAVAAKIKEAEALLAAHHESIAVKKAALKQAQAEHKSTAAKLPQKLARLRVAEIELDRTIIRSPVKGIVIKRDVERGQTVAASLKTPRLFTIAQDLKVMQVNASIDETDIGRIKIGQKAFFTVDAFAERQFDGRLTQIRKAPIRRGNVVTYTVIIKSGNPDGVLLPGMTALLEIIVMGTGEILKMPRAALAFKPPNAQTLPHQAETTQQDPSTRMDTVWKLDAGGRPVPASVQLGINDASSIEITGGAVDEGDRVIVSAIPAQTDRRLFGIRVGF